MFEVDRIARAVERGPIPDRVVIRLNDVLRANDARESQLVRMRSLALCVIAWLCLTGIAANAANAAAPLEIYGRLPLIEDVALSPDGSRIAYVRTTQNMRIIAVVSLVDNKVIAALRVGDQKLRSIEWADDNRLMIDTSSTGLPWGLSGSEREWHLLQVFNVVNHKSTPVPDPNPRKLSDVRTMNVISGRVMVRHIDGHTVLFVPGLYVENQTLPALFRFDLETGKEKLISRGSSITKAWLVGGDGEVVAEQDYDEKDQRWALKIRREGHLQEAVFGHEAIDFPRILGFGPSPDTLLILSIEGEESMWRLLSLKDGTLGTPMAEHKLLNAPIEDRRTYRVIGGVHTGDDARYEFFDPQMQERWDTAIHAFEGERLRLVSWSDDFQKFVVQVNSPKHGFYYDLIDLNARTAGSIGEVYGGGILPLAVRRITYAAADGMQIPAYLTLPRGRAERSLPLIVLAHGGPASHDTAGFAWWPQALTEQGYAVLQVNYRGSDLSQRFLAAGFGQWGRKMQTDLSDGVRHLVTAGIADPARVCIVGASYGGYAALAGVTLDPGVYRCAVSVAGIADLKRMLDWVNEKGINRHNIEERYWDRFMGVSGPGDPVLETISPIKHIDVVNVPVLLIHGRDDTVVPFNQSSEMFNALRRANKDVEFVTLQHEDHWLSRSETRLQMLQASVAFLRAHNPPD
jgi:dipeptidyl aminopeptidase/acylaminoacyl peptidase